MTGSEISFAAFYLIWAEVNGWDVPDFQLKVCEFLQDYGSEGLLMIPRGHGKSTFLDVYNAWEIVRDPEVLILHQGATDPDAYKVSRGTQMVLARHPVCVELGAVKARGETQKWWVQGTSDVRHGTMHARGILSNVTGSRATLIQNDDVEVPGNIGTEEAREKLRTRLSEQTHILIPGGRLLWVGTPHTHNSLYTDVRERGARCFIRKAFAQECRHDGDTVQSMLCPFRPLVVFAGVGKLCQSLEFTAVPQFGGGFMVHVAEPAHMLDCYAGALWPERFTPAEMLARRRKCRTLGEWDSQYQLHARPVGEVRLDPDRASLYEVDVRRAVGPLTDEPMLMLGQQRLENVGSYWYCALGRVGGDASALCVVYRDPKGVLYWHRAEPMQGDIDAQCLQAARLAVACAVPALMVETNGVGGFVPAQLRKVVHDFRLPLRVVEVPQTRNKQERILAAFEGPLSTGSIWLHTSVMDGEAGTQMRQFNPLAKNDRDDYLDAAAGAILSMPVLARAGNPAQQPHQDWRMTERVIDAPTFRPEL